MRLFGTYAICRNLTKFGTIKNVKESPYVRLLSNLTYGLFLIVNIDFVYI
ncbi:hypothetical protein BC2926_06720 [Bacillus cereus]|nr:hypothetical protein BC2926_06720 [Bacillus cereus]